MFLKNTLKNFLIASLFVSSIAINSEIKAEISDEAKTGLVITGIFSIAAIAGASLLASSAFSNGQRQNELISQYNNKEITFHELSIKTRDGFSWLYKILMPQSSYNFPVQMLINDAAINSFWLWAFGKTLMNENYTHLSSKLKANIQQIEKDEKFNKNQRKYSKAFGEEQLRNSIYRTAQWRRY